MLSFYVLPWDPHRKFRPCSGSDYRARIVYKPKVVDLRLDEISPALKTECLDVALYRWGNQDARVYMHKDDERTRGKIALFILASRLFGMISGVAK